MTVPLLILAAYGVSHFGLWLYTSRKYPNSTVFAGGRKWLWFATLMLVPFLGPMFFLSALGNVEPRSQPRPGRLEQRSKRNR